MNRAQRTGKQLMRAVELVVLAVIGVATVIAIGQEVYAMVELGVVRLADLLMLFLYLEVLTMVAAYVESHKLPVRMPIYIAIVALARFLVLDIKEMGNWELVAVSGAVLILALAVLAIRYGHVRFPYEKNLEGNPLEYPPRS
ncbi:phosphate-starvation-inducible protein PsiE [Thiohalorhabdus sp.]|uniref:phosphate-starvation-inducible protein PsiE n=1 Tax=Thiohalorhabdus sp. TaxID=3094134 RepID=UPI002FC3CBE5